MGTIRSLCVLCGSSDDVGADYQMLARDLGRLLAARDIELVYGGAQVGLMGHVANACMEANGQVTGVIPGGLFKREVPHRGLRQLHEVGSMHERKELMYDLADGFIALPGGLGTLEELAEVATWSQIGLHSKPCVLLDLNGFWDPLIAQLDLMVRERFLRPENRLIIQRCHTAEEALRYLGEVDLPHADQWITPDER